MKKQNKIMSVSLGIVLFIAGLILGLLIHFSIKNDVSLTYQQMLSNYSQAFQACQGYNPNSGDWVWRHDLCRDIARNYADAFFMFNCKFERINGRLEKNCPK